MMMMMMMWHVIDIGEIISEFCAVSEKLALRSTCQSARTAVGNVASHMLPPQVTEHRVDSSDHWSHHEDRNLLYCPRGIKFAR
jgi:hypothetical protein